MSRKKKRIKIMIQGPNRRTYFRKGPITLHVSDDGHFIDDPLVIVNAKPDFEGLGMEPIYNDNESNEFH